MKTFLAFAACLFIAIGPSIAQQPNMSLIPYRKGNAWGYASPDRKIVINAEYEDAGFFYAGYAAVKKNGMYGYINTSGVNVIPFKFYVAKQFRYGYFDNPKMKKTDTVLFFGAALTKSGYEHCFDSHGVQMRKCPAINENVVPEEKVIETIPEKVYANVKANGDIYDKIYDDYQIGDSKYYIASKNGKFGVFNNVFEIVIPYEYDQMKRLTNKNGYYLEVEKGGLSGILKGDGTVHLPVDNNLVTFVKSNGGNEFLVIMKNGLSQLKDLQLNTLSKGDFSTIEYDKESGFVMTTPTKLTGYYFAETGKQVGAVYSKISTMTGGSYIQVSYPSGRTGFVNSNADNFFED